MILEEYWRKKICIILFYIMYYFVCFRTGKNRRRGDRIETRHPDIAMYIMGYASKTLYRAFRVAMLMAEKSRGRRLIIFIRVIPTYMNNIIIMTIIGPPAARHAASSSGRFTIPLDVLQHTKDARRVNFYSIVRVIKFFFKY